MTDQVVSMRLPVEVVGRLDAAAKQAGLSRTALVLRLCEFGLAQGGGEEAMRGPESGC